MQAMELRVVCPACQRGMLTLPPARDGQATCAKLSRPLPSHGGHPRSAPARGRTATPRAADHGVGADRAHLREPAVAPEPARRRGDARLLRARVCDDRGGSAVDARGSRAGSRLWAGDLRAPLRAYRPAGDGGRPGSVSPDAALRGAAGGGRGPAQPRCASRRRPGAAVRGRPIRSGQLLRSAASLSRPGAGAQRDRARPRARRPFHRGGLPAPRRPAGTVGHAGAAAAVRPGCVPSGRAVGASGRSGSRRDSLPPRGGRVVDHERCETRARSAA